MTPEPTPENEVRVLVAMMTSAYAGRGLWRLVVNSNSKWLRAHFDGARAPDVRMAAER